MKYLTIVDREQLMRENENENLYYQVVDIKYNYTVGNEITGETFKKEISDRAFKLVINNENVFLVVDRYADSDPYYLKFEEKELLNISDTLEKRIFTFDQKKEAARIKRMPYVEKGITEQNLIKIHDRKKGLLKP